MPEPTLSPDAYRQLVEQSPALTWRSNLTRGCDYFNERWLGWTGRTMEQEMGEGWAASVHPDDHDRCLAAYTTAFDARTPFELEYRLRRADGAFRWILDRGVPYRDAAGVFAGYIGSCLDIHDTVEGRDAKVRLQVLEMRQLSGLLPVCGQCKRVRDDVGYWQSVEQFVTAHSDARFTYGYCPTCFETTMAGLQAEHAEDDTWVLPGL